MKKILIDTLLIVAMFILMVFGLLTCRAYGQEPRVKTIDGVQYRLFTAEELKPILSKLVERDILLDENKVLDATLKETFDKLEKLEENHSKQLKLVTTKLEGERNFWKSQYEAEHENLLRFQGLYKSCSARILGLFRICRL